MVVFDDVESDSSNGFSGSSSLSSTLLLQVKLERTTYVGTRGRQLYSAQFGSTGKLGKE